MATFTTPTRPFHPPLALPRPNSLPTGATFSNSVKYTPKFERWDLTTKSWKTIVNTTSFSITLTSKTLQGQEALTHQAQLPWNLHNNNIRYQDYGMFEINTRSAQALHQSRKNATYNKLQNICRRLHDNALLAPPAKRYPQRNIRRFNILAPPAPLDLQYSNLAPSYPAVYALVHPDPTKAPYIGTSINPASRAQDHLQAVRRNFDPQHNGGTDPNVDQNLARVYQQCRASGKLPIFVILCEIFTCRHGGPHENLTFTGTSYQNRTYNKKQPRLRKGQRLPTSTLPPQVPLHPNVSNPPSHRGRYRGFGRGGGGTRRTPLVPGTLAYQKSQRGVPSNFRRTDKRLRTMQKVSQTRYVAPLLQHLKDGTPGKNQPKDWDQIKFELEQLEAYFINQVKGYAFGLNPDNNIPYSLYYDN